MRKARHRDGQATTPRIGDADTGELRKDPLDAGAHKALCIIGVAGAVGFSAAKYQPVVFRQAVVVEHELRVGDGSIAAEVRAAFPYPLTGSQETAIAEIVADLAKPQRMLRLAFYELTW